MVPIRGPGRMLGLRVVNKLTHIAIRTQVPDCKARTRLDLNHLYVSTVGLSVNVIQYTHMNVSRRKSATQIHARRTPASRTSVPSAPPSVLLFCARHRLRLHHLQHQRRLHNSTACAHAVCSDPFESSRPSCRCTQTPTVFMHDAKRSPPADSPPHFNHDLPHPRPTYARCIQARDACLHGAGTQG